MQFNVIAADGNKYGPVDLNTLNSWAVEGRVVAGTDIEDLTSGQTLKAASVPGIMLPGQVAPPPPGPYVQQQNPYGQPQPGPYGQPGAQPGGQWSQPPSPYPRGMGGPGQRTSSTESALLWRSITYSALALIFFFFVHGIGLIFGAYAIMYAGRLQSTGHKAGIPALAVSIVVMLIIIGGWVLRVSGS